MKTRIEADPKKMSGLLARFAELGEAHGASALRRVVGMLDASLLGASPGYDEHEYQPQTLCMPGLRPRKFHDTRSPPLNELRETLERAFPAIREEAVRLLEMRDLYASFVDKAYDRDKFKMNPEDWKEAFLRGGTNPAMNPRVQELCPATTAALRSLSGHVTGDASFSVLQPGKVIPPHYGEINFRLTVHLPLVVEGDCGLEAGGERHRSREGECFVFDDGFLHHAWNHGRAPRVHLLFMIWNPEVTEAERAALEQLLASFHRPRRLPLGERLLRTLVEERVAERGADSADLSEVSAPAFREGVARLRAAADGLLADEVRGRLDLLDAFRQASLFPQLDWDAPPTPEGALTGAEALISRKPTSFALVEGASPTGGPTMVVVCGDRQIELEGPLVPVVREALSGEPFRVSTIAGALPDGAPRRAALHLLDVLRREGLLELVEPEG